MGKRMQQRAGDEWGSRFTEPNCCSSSEYLNGWSGAFDGATRTLRCSPEIKHDTLALFPSPPGSWVLPMQSAPWEVRRIPRVIRMTHRLLIPFPCNEGSFSRLSRLQLAWRTSDSSQRAGVWWEKNAAKTLAPAQGKHCCWLAMHMP